MRYLFNNSANAGLPSSGSIVNGITQIKLEINSGDQKDPARKTTACVYIEEINPKITFADNGNIGIGVSNPSFPLDVKGDIKVSGAGRLFFSELADGVISLLPTFELMQSKSLNIYSGSTLKNGGTGGALNLFGGQTGGATGFGGNVNIQPGWGLGGINYGNVALAANGGNVGIGTATPTFLLDIKSSALNNNQVRIMGETNSQNAQLVIESSSNINGATAGIRFKTQGGWDVMLRTNKNNNWLELTDNAGVQHHRWVVGDYIASGRIKAKEVAVVLNPLTDPWPDYVFDKKYNLKSLKELDSFISENHHLPEVPSANEVEKEGIQLGKMNGILLKKLEEMTLYLLDQERRIKEQDDRIRKLERE